MNRILLSLFVAGSLTGCVSQKKYAELEARLSEAKGSEAATAAMQAEIKRLEGELMVTKQQAAIEADQQRLAISDMKRLVAAFENPQLSPEQQRMMHEQSMREREMAMMEARHNTPESARTTALGEQEQKLKMCFDAVYSAISDYEASAVSVQRESGMLVVKVSREVFFGTSKNTISPSGQTLLARLKPGLQLAQGLPVEVWAFTEGNMSSGAADAAQAAAAIADAMGPSVINKVSKLSVEVQPCAGAARCDWVWIVVNYNHPALHQLENPFGY